MGNAPFYGALRISGGTIAQFGGRYGGNLVVLSVYRLEHLSLDSTQFSEASRLRLADHVLRYDRCPSLPAYRTLPRAAAGNVQSGESKPVGRSSNLCNLGDGDWYGTEDLERCANSDQARGTR